MEEKQFQGEKERKERGHWGMKMTKIHFYMYKNGREFFIKNFLIENFCN